MPRLQRRRVDIKRNKLAELALRFATAPAAAFLLTWLVFAERAVLPQALVSGLPAAFWIFTGVGMVMSGWFHRSRIFFILALLAVFYTVLNFAVPSGFNPEATRKAEYYFAALFMPLNMIILACAGEGSLLSTRGKGYAAFFGLELLFSAAAIVSQDADMMGVIAREFAGSSGPVKMPFTSSVLSSLALIVLGLRQLWRKSPAESALLYTVPILAAILCFEPDWGIQSILFAGAAAILTTGAIQDSYVLAYLDELTGLPGRRSLQDEMAQLGDVYTVAMLDIDHFKKFNDQYGHDVGDQALQLVAALAGNAAGGGRAFRYGGEEFALVYDGKTLVQTLPYLEELRQRIEQRPFILRGSKTRQHRQTITVSIGAAERSRGQTAEAVLKEADKALYRAKDGGRNRVAT